MAFPASTVTVKEAWDLMRTTAVRIKARVQTLSDLSATNTTGRQSYVDLRKSLIQSVATWNSVQGTPGLEAYARTQIDDNTLNLVTEYTTMRDAAISLQTWIGNNVPQSGGAVLTHDIEGTELTFSTAQTAGFRTEAAAFIATIG